MSKPDLNKLPDINSKSSINPALSESISQLNN